MGACRAGYAYNCRGRCEVAAQLVTWASCPCARARRPWYGGSVAQRLEQGSHKPLVLGSNPSTPSVLLNRVISEGEGNETDICCCVAGGDDAVDRKCFGG